MPRSRAKALALTAFLAILIAGPVQAQPADSSVPGAGRDASFLPPPSFDNTPAPTAPTPNSNINPAPAVTPTAPASGVAPVAAPVPPQAPSPPTAAAPPTVISPVVAPASVSPPEPVSQPVEEARLSNIDPESIGLLSASEDGLGAAMWKGTARDLVERLLPQLSLPSFSPVLNNLAQRFLLTIADAPRGKPLGARSLVAMRVNALIALGDIKGAWKLIALAKPDLIDDGTLRRATEFMLTTDQAADVCPKLPDTIKARPKADWQELLLVCQLDAKDTKAAQLTLDLMRSQDIRDDTLFFLAEHNIIGGGKELPRQLTPLRPLVFALLQQIGQPLRSELYAHPDAALIPGILAMKTREDNLRLSFAERAGERGLITPTQLEAVYADVVFPAQAISAAANTTETGGHLHALLYQAAMQKDVTPQVRVALAVKFVRGATAAGLNGAEAHVLADIIGTAHPSDADNQISASVARIYLMAGNPQAALEWLKQARHAAIGMPGVAAELQNLWPLTVLSGLETDSDYGPDLGKWLNAALTSSGTKDDTRILRERAGSVLLLLDASGFAVPEENWARVISVPVSERHIVPPAVLLERLREAGTANKRGEAVLLSLLLSGGGNQDEQEPTPLLSTLEIVRALRLTGLTVDASMLAREAAGIALFPPADKQ